MRRQSLVASVVLTAAFVTLVALPGVAGSQTPSNVRPLTAAAFQQVRLPASDGGSMAIRPLDAGYESAGHLDDTAPLIESGDDAPRADRSAVLLPASVLRELLASPTPRAAAKPTLRTTARSTTTKRPTVSRPTVTKAASAPTTPYKRVLAGLASWYDNGTTAMRLPRGTRIRICGAQSCVYRVVRDWGPARYLSDRVVDLTPADFKAVTGRGLGAGLAPVKVYIY